jgi:hypothetical protein
MGKTAGMPKTRYPNGVLVVSQEVCPWGSIIAFPGKPGKERREGP